MSKVPGFGTSTYFTSTGHGGVINDADPQSQRRGLNAMLGPALADYYYDLAERLRPKYGAAASYVHNIGSATIFPNFSWLTGRQTLRVWHPKGPLETEVWTWTLVNRDCPDDLKKQQRRTSVQTFGPAGIFEQDDAENWSQCTATMRGYIGRQLTMPYLAGRDAGRREPRRRTPESRSHSGTAAAPRDLADRSTDTGST